MTPGAQVVEPVRDPHQLWRDGSLRTGQLHGDRHRRCVSNSVHDAPGDLVDTTAVTGQFDLTDAQWAVLVPLLPTSKRPGRPSLWTKRQLIDGMRWRVRVGASWRDVPVEYGSWSAVYALFRRWQRDGTWRQIVTALHCLADAAGRISWDVSANSTIARAHQHTAGARKKAPL